MAISATDIDKGLTYAFKNANRIKDFSKLTKRNSIMKMADPAMYQYPILMSNGIETPVGMAIAQAYQQTYAGSVVTAYSLNSSMSLKKYEQAADYVKRFHSNDGVPSNFRAAANAIGVAGIESATEIDDTDLNVDIKDATVLRTFSKEVLESLSVRAWDRIEDHLDGESLNDMYRPYDRTKRILNEKLNSLKVTNEGFKDSFDNISGFMDDVNKSVTNDSNDRNSVKLGGGTQYYQGSRTYDKDGNLREIRNGGVKSTPKVEERKFVNSIVRKDKLEAMEPTMVNVQIVCHGNDTKGSPVQFTQNLVIGVKSMVRLVSSELMVASMVEACKESNIVFKFLKWTKGERKTLDFVLGISKSKKKALEKNAKMEIKVLNQSKKRGKAGLLKRALNNEVLPTLTVVLTTYEVERIKEICGVDLSDLRQAIKLMDKYYLLSLAIYDPVQNTLQTMFDCDDDWSFVNVGSMKSMIDKTTDLMNQNEMLKLFGRR